MLYLVSVVAVEMSVVVVFGPGVVEVVGADVVVVEPSVVLLAQLAERPANICVLALARGGSYQQSPCALMEQIPRG